MNGFRETAPRMASMERYLSFTCGLIVMLSITSGTRARDIAAAQGDSLQSDRYPMRNGSESAKNYAARIGLEYNKVLNLGNQVFIELVLIPPGEFLMGVPNSSPPTETTLTGQSVFIVGIITALSLCIAPITSVISRKRRFKYSLIRFIIFIFALQVCGYGIFRWIRATNARREYDLSMNRLADAPKSEKPAHIVKLTRPFYMSRYPITQQQYQVIMGMNPSIFKGKVNPVDTVSWNDARDFCLRVTKALDISVALPTEAEWEYACRAGTRSSYYNGDTPADLERIAWFGSNSGGSTHPVGQKEPNEFGLYDMLGNVFEWCADQYAEDYYANSPTINPTGPILDSPDEQSRIIRGGGWNCTAYFLRCSFRGKYPQAFNDLHYGFRIIVRVSDEGIDTKLK